MTHIAGREVIRLVNPDVGDSIIDINEAIRDDIQGATDYEVSVVSPDNSDSVSDKTLTEIEKAKGQTGGNITVIFAHKPGTANGSEGQTTGVNDTDPKKTIHRRRARRSRYDDILFEDHESLEQEVLPVEKKWLGKRAIGGRRVESGITLDKQVEAAEMRLRELESDGHVTSKQGVIVSGINSEGGSGITSTLALVASLTARTKANTYVVDHKRNGVMEDKFQIRSKLTIKELSRRVLDELGDSTKLSGSATPEGQLISDAVSKIRRLIPYDRENGVRVISADKSYNLPDRFDAKDTNRVLDTVDILADHQFYDLGNTLNDPVTLAALRRTNVFMFTANVMNEESLWQLQSSMQELRNLEGGIFRERVDRSIVVFIGLKNTDGINNLIEKFLPNIDDNGEINGEYSHQGKVIAIPYIEALSNHGRIPVKLDELKPKNIFGKVNLAPYLAYLKLSIAIFEERERQIKAGIDYTSATQ